MEVEERWILLCCFLVWLVFGAICERFRFVVDEVSPPQTGTKYPFSSLGPASLIYLRRSVCQNGFSSGFCRRVASNTREVIQTCKDAEKLLKLLTGLLEAGWSGV